MLKLAIIGDGRMGQRIKELAPTFGVEPALVLGLNNNTSGSGITSENFNNIDIAIDFSHPDSVKTHIEKVSKLGVPLVVGTTAWYDDSGWVESLVEKHNSKVVYGSNFSLGVQLFMKLAEKAGELFGNSEEFDASLHEVHHTKKADAPSGTAITLAGQWLKGSGVDKKITYGVEPKGAVSEDSLRITSQRTGSVFGDHSIRINSVWDDIELTHRARSRDGFAAGALKTAIWLHEQNKQGFFLIEDIVESVLQDSGK